MILKVHLLRKFKNIKAFKFGFAVFGNNELNNLVFSP